MEPIDFMFDMDQLKSAKRVFEMHPTPGFTIIKEMEAHGTDAFWVSIYFDTPTHLWYFVLLVEQDIKYLKALEKSMESLRNHFKKPE